MVKTEKSKKSNKKEEPKNAKLLYFRKMTDLTELDELDYGDIDDKYDDTEVNLENPNGNKNKGIKNDSKEPKEIHSDDGQIESDTEVQSDDGEIKSGKILLPVMKVIKFCRP